MSVVHGVRADRSPARKAVALSSFGALQFHGTGPQQLHDDVGQVQRSPSEIAAGGFSGGGGEIPHRAQMEQSFGRDFSNVQAYSGGPARKANEDLGANAYAMGNQVAFKTASPSPALVAHELTHVVQQTEGPAGSGATHGGIDTSGEAQAEAVEAAVASGKPATSVLGGGGGGEGGPALSEAPGAAPPKKKGGEATTDGSEEKEKAEVEKKAQEESGQSGGEKKKVGPAKKKAPALDFGMGTTFSMEGLEKSYEWTFWDKSFSWPIGPGINVIVKPSVKAAVKGKINYAGEDKGDASAALELQGSVGVGISGGVPNVAEVYAVLEPGVSGSGEFTKKKNGDSKVKLGAAIKVAGKIGVSLGGGIVDYAFQLFEAELLRIGDIEWTNGKKTGSGVMKPGKDIKPIIDAITAIIEKAKATGAAIYNGAVRAGNYIADTASAAYNWVTSW